MELDLMYSKMCRQSLETGKLTLYHIISHFNDPWKEAFKKDVAKGENAGNQHFSLLPQYFLPYQRQIPPTQPLLMCHLSSTDAFGQG